MILALQAALREYPVLWRCTSDLAGQTQRQSIDNVADSELLTASLHKGLHEMRREMGFAMAPPLEQLLIEQVLLTWNSGCSSMTILPSTSWSAMKKPLEK